MLARRPWRSDQLVLPGSAYIRLMLRIDAPAAMTIGTWRIDPVPEAAIHGPTSRAMEVQESRGITVGFGVSALGWARLTRWRASDAHNLVLPASRILGTGVAERLTGELRDVPVEDLKARLDALLPSLLGAPHPDEARIRELTAILLQNEGEEIGKIAARLCLEPTTLRRLALRHFGMTPKLLARRARFLRSYQRITRLSGGTDYADIDPSYYDVSHFLRDAQTFLGMTPRRFHQLQRPQWGAALRVCTPIPATLHD